MPQAEQYICPNCGMVFRAGTEDVFRQGDIRACPGCCARVRIDLPPPPLPPMDAAAYGHSLAERVADYLQAGGEIPGRHPYFSGVCLAQCDGAFLYGYANEGGAPAFALGDSCVICRFGDRASFVAWLAAQSDDSLNRGPGTGLRPGDIGITRRTIEAAVGCDSAELQVRPAGGPPK
jgi:hypothetical protein